MRSILFLLVIPWFLVYGLVSDTDTTRTYTARDVVVTATRVPSHLSDVPATVHILTDEDFTVVPLPTLVDVLRSVEGVYINDYGTTGGSKSVSFRGFSPTNTLVLYNGIPLNNPQYGSIDLSTVPLQNIERIEVLHGGASSLYGENATGGVLHIVTRPPSRDFHAKVLAGGSTYLGRTYGIHAEGTTAGVGILGGMTYESGKDNFPYTLGTTEVRRKNADYRRRHAYTTLTYGGFAPLDLRATAELINFEHGVPGSTSWPTDDARQHDKIFRTTLNAQVQMSDQVRLQADFYSIAQTQYYREPSVWSPTDLTYKTKSNGVSLLSEVSVASYDRLVGGVSLSENALTANGLSWGTPLGMSPHRTSTSVWCTNEYIYQTDAVYLDRTVLTASGRYDYASDIEKGAFSPKLGLTVRLLRAYDVRVWASVGKNFRAPTFNDLYYPNFSNPSLKPEYSTTYEVGLRTSLDDMHTHKLSATYFANTVKDKIVLNAAWIPYNIGSAEHTGTEVRYDYHAPSNTFDAYIGLSFFDARKTNKVSSSDPTYRKRLPNVPLSTGVMGFRTVTALGTFAANTSFTGKRYTDELNTTSLPAYALTDVSYSVTQSFGPLKATFTLALNNVFDVAYSVINDYPMPGRTYRMLVSVLY